MLNYCCFGGKHNEYVGKVVIDLKKPLMYNGIRLFYVINTWNGRHNLSIKTPLGERGVFMRKKIYALVCAGVIIASLCGCGVIDQTLPPYGEGQVMWDPDSVVQDVTEEPSTEPAVEVPICTYEINGGTITFTGTGRIEAKTSKTTPAWLDDIGSMDNITSIVISEGITEIDENAFAGAKNLESVTIPKTVKVIPEGFARNCIKLNTLVLPNGVEEIGEGAFSGCEALPTLEIPSSVKKIDKHAFSSCKLLTEVVVPDSVTSLGAYAFATCDNLVKITVGKGVTIMPTGLCAKDPALKEVVMLGAVKQFESKVFVNCTGLEELVIPDGTERIADGVFSECDALQKITIPASVTFIAAEQFKTAYEGVVIYCYEGSEAHAHALREDKKFEFITE